SFPTRRSSDLARAVVPSGGQNDANEAGRVPTHPIQTRIQIAPATPQESESDEVTEPGPPRLCLSIMAAVCMESRRRGAQGADPPAWKGGGPPPTDRSARRVADRVS